MGSERHTLTPNPSPGGRGELTAPTKASNSFISLSPRERAGVRVPECSTHQEKESEKLDAVTRKNLEVLGYGE